MNQMFYKRSINEEMNNQIPYTYVSKTKQKKTHTRLTKSLRISYDSS